MTDYQFTFNGLTFGGVGAAVQVEGVQGVEDTPEVRAADEGRGFADGMFYGRDFLGGRTITVDLLLLTGSLSYRQTVNAVKTAFLPYQGTTLPLTWTLPGETTKRAYVRCRRRSIPMDQDYTHGYGHAVVQFYAADPRVYEDTASTVTIGLPSAVGGRTYNRTYNLTYGAVSAANTAVATNVGTYPTKPVVTLIGPVDTPYVQNTTTGQFLKFNIVLATGDTLAIDFDARSVVLNGTASRRSALSVDSQWFDLNPGSNTLLYSAAGFTASTATVTWRSAYL